MTYRTLIGGLFASLWLLALPAWAMEYRLEVTNVDFLTLSSYMGKVTPWWHQNEPLGRLEGRLDAQQFSPAAVLPGRQVHLLEDPRMAARCPPASRCSRPPGIRPGPPMSGTGSRGTLWSSR
jgi:hypothetical protein